MPDTAPLGPPADCQACPRLASYRSTNRETLPDFHNAPVESFGDLGGRLLIVGLAPGLKGANRTGRPFTGDYAGDLLYQTLPKFGLARGRYDRRPDDGFELLDCRLTNAVRCVPPENKPLTEEVKACQKYLRAELSAMKRLQVVLALGMVAHGAVLSALGHRKSHFPFGHGAEHDLPGGLALADSYHCSRYNTNTGRLTAAMFETVFQSVKSRLS